MSNQENQENKEWQINVIWKNKHYCTFYDNQMSSIFVIMSMCENWFQWDKDYRLLVSKEIKGINNHITYYSRICKEGIEMIEVEYTLLPSGVRKEN